jgi:hypothetical protein
MQQIFFEAERFRPPLVSDERASYDHPTRVLWVTHCPEAPDNLELSILEAHLSQGSIIASALPINSKLEDLTTGIYLVRFVRRKRPDKRAD